MGILPFVLLLLSSASLTSSNRPPSPPPSSDGPLPGANKYQLLYIKNAKPYVLLDQYDHHRQIRGGKSGMKSRAMKPDTWINGRRTRGNVGVRPFYVMLPKGFVPSSGSSPCHNLYPTSSNEDHFECRYVTKKLKP